MSMRIQQIAKNYYEVSHEDGLFYGTLEQALNEALVVAKFGKQEKLFADVKVDESTNIPPGFNSEGEPAW